jgi:GT2 family glycosyltransferase
LKTAVVILNWNGRHLLESFLPALIRFTHGKARLIVADNASSDDSLNWLRNTHPEIDIITNHVNEGFAKGYNTVLKNVSEEYLLLLNSDVEVTENWLAPLETWLNSHPETAVCQPKILWHKNRQQFEYAGAAGGYIDHLGYPFCRGRIFGHLENDHGQYNNPVPVFWASGACMMIRNKVFREAGGFDASFFAHMEEIDICWRIRNMGYEIMCIPDSEVFHVGGATLPKNNPGKTLLNFRNNLSMLYKHLPPNKVFTVILLRLFLDGAAGIKFMLEGHGSDCIAVVKAHFQFYLRLLNGTIKRNLSEPKKLHPTIYRRNIAWQHYVLGKKEFSELNFHPEKALKSKV